MKVGLLGAGRIGVFHATALAGDHRVEEVVVGDVDTERAAALAEKVGGESGTIEEVIGSGLDAVAIAATTSAHAGLIKACLDAGLPVFCEKPVALGYEETVEIVDRVEWAPRSPGASTRSSSIQTSAVTGRSILDTSRWQ